MRLQLKYKPIPENAAKFAADIVGAAAEVSGATLDYSIESLQKVDEIIEGLRRDGCKPDQIAATLFAFGCYVGEVFVRQVGGRWRNASETSMADIAGFLLVVELSEEKLVNPIGKVFKRLENGPEDSLPYFYHVFTREA
jgi:hypothetical protein